MKSKNRMLGLAGVLILVLAACGDGGGGAGEFDLVTPGTLTVCTDVPYPPMEFEDPDAPSGYTGFDIELMRTIATGLDLELAVVTPGFDAITSGLAMEAGDCDISAASITITEDREENVDFSDPYFNAEQSLLVLADSGFTALSDLSAVAVQTGTTGEIWVEENGPEGLEVVSFEGAGDLYLALQAGEVDGVITDIVGNQGYADENTDSVIAETYDTDEEYGFAVKEEGSEALLEAVNEALAQFMEDGTYDDIYGEWFPES